MGAVLGADWCFVMQNKLSELSSMTELLSEARLQQALQGIKEHKHTHISSIWFV